MVLGRYMVRALCGAADVPSAGRRLMIARSARAAALGWAPSWIAAFWVALSWSAVAGLPCASAAEVSQPGAALVTARASAASAAAELPKGAPARGESARLVLRRSRLDNGLRVVLNRDPALPTVAIGIAYAVGTRHEGQDEQGFARWLQHAMLGGSRNVAAGEHVRRIRDQGGSHGAWTSADHTLFVDVLPAHALALGLWLEADRMKSLELSSAEVAWQARLLELELEREARAPSARGARELRALVFGEPPGAAPPRSAATQQSPAFAPRTAQLLPALRAFHQRYYAPNNAVLTLSGSFEVLEALNLIQTYFADAEPVELPPAPDAQPQERQQARRVSLQGHRGQGPALWQGWSVPGARTAEHDALELARLILGAGVGSRLNQLLISEKGLAREVAVWLDGGRGPDLFGVEVQLREGTDPEQAGRLVQAQIAGLARFGPSAAELLRAQRMLETSSWVKLDGNLARARALCEAELFAHDARLLEADRARYRQVTREAVQGAVARYLRPSRRSDVLLRVRQQ